MHIAPPFAPIPSLANPPSLLVNLLGFEADEIPATVSSAPVGAEELAANAGFVAITTTRDDADALSLVGLCSVAVVPADLDLFLTTTGRAPTTIERLTRSSGLAIFLYDANASKASIKAIDATIASLRAVKLFARAYRLPRGFFNVQDWLHACGGLRVQAALQSAADRTLNRQKPPQGLIPLGRRGDGLGVYVFSIDQSAIIPFRHSDLIKEASLLGAGGGRWCYEVFPTFDKKTNEPIINTRKIGGWVRDECVDRGIFRQDKVRAAGVWVDGDDIVVNTKNPFYGSDGCAVNPVGDWIYIDTHDLGISYDVQPATTEMVRRLYETLDTFSFSKRSNPTTGRLGTDALMLLGWLMCSYLCAALPHRPHCYVHADQGGGKTTLLTFLDWLMGESCHQSTGSSAAGIQQAMKQRATSLLLDESNASSRHIAGLMNYMCDGFDGTKKEMGTATHENITFEIRSMGIMVGVYPPEMDPMHRSRFLKLQLETVPAGTPKTPGLPNDKNDKSPEFTALGKQLFARAFDTWPRLLKTMALVKVAMKTSGRAADTLAPMVAAAYVGMFDDEMETIEDADAWISEFDLEEDKAQIVNVSASGAFFTSLLQTVVTADRTHDLSVSQLMAKAQDDSLRGVFKNDLGQLGMKIHREIKDGQQIYELRIGVKHAGFVKLAKTIQPGVSYEDLLKRLPGASQKLMQDSIGGCKGTAYISLPYAQQSLDEVPVW